MSEIQNEGIRAGNRIENDGRSVSGAPAEGHAVRDFFSTDEIFQRVAATADEEVNRPFRLMFFSGLAAGLSIGLSFYARAAVTSQVPGFPLIGNLVYPIGFILIVIGRYQLYTENTLTPVTLVLTRIASLPTLIYVWGTVLLANLLGAFILAFSLATTGIFTPEAAEIAIGFWEHAAELSWNTLFFKGIVAGWLVASMVWLIHAARDTVTRVFLVVFMMFLIPSGDLFHCIIGFCEAMYAVLVGEATVMQATGGFFLPVFLGNTIGGVGLVAILNFSMTDDARFPDRDCGRLELTWREWLLGLHRGTSETYESSNAPLKTEVGEEDHVRGPDGAPLVFVQYGDIECPVSYDIYKMVEDLAPMLSADYQYVYRHLPLSRRHPYAMQASIAADAAGKQGYFWDMVEVLSENHQNLEMDDIYMYAENLGLDMAKFENDMQSDDLRAHVEESRRDAINNGVTRTRNLFINGQRYKGDWSTEGIRDEAQKILRREQPSRPLKEVVNVAGD